MSDDVGANSSSPERLLDCFLGCLMGTAVGDAIGLPVEGLSRRRQTKLFPQIRGPRLLCGHGMASDDTEHTCMVACSLVVANESPDSLSRDFGRMLRYWLLTIPAGVGWATLRGIIKLWLGFRPDRSGVFSAGNGPAMRSAILGLYFHDSFSSMRDSVKAITRVTHSDPKAEHGAFAVALAASHMYKSHNQRMDIAQYLRDLRTCLQDEGQELFQLIESCAGSVTRGEATLDYARHMGLSKGVSGYVCHTVPVALHAVMTHAPDFKAAILSAVECGGDTDTTAAIVGGVMGSGIGCANLPRDWIENLWLWPLDEAWMRGICSNMLSRKKGASDFERTRYPFWKAYPRNMVFLFIVLMHAFRRLLPPF